MSSPRVVLDRRPAGAESVFGLPVLLRREEIGAEVTRLGREISEDYRGNELVIVATLRGSFVFVADLVRQLSFPVVVDFIQVASYGTDTHSSGEIRLQSETNISVDGRHVLVLDEIADSGVTADYLKRYLRHRGSASVRTGCLLDKPSRRRVELFPDYVGFTIANHFVVGYGMDHGERYRHLPDICVLPDGEAGHAT